MPSRKNIAVVTPAFNDFDNVPSFIQNVRVYSGNISQHIIVDNNSSVEYRQILKDSFPHSTILYRIENGGTTAAFNDGIRCALENGAEAILLLTQDLHLQEGAVENLVDILFSDPTIGVAGGVLLRGGVEDQIQEFGGSIDVRTMDTKRHFVDCSVKSVWPPVLDVDFISGGMNMAKREVYEKVGLQDERLFMYLDEVDWDLRVKRCGFRLVVSKSVVGVHEHIAPRDKGRLRFIGSFFYVRNQLLLIREYNGICTFTKALVGRYVKFAMRLFRKDAFHSAYYFLGMLSATLGPVDPIAPRFRELLTRSI